ncbi:MAG: hypothetical protein QOK41_546, partial [Sphingomonadales bacterium]|nr:hypothetical protein [Sphingomonadales bacterium]
MRNLALLIVPFLFATTLNAAPGQPGGPPPAENDAKAV